MLKLDDVMKITQAIEELRNAVNYINTLYSCDDRDLKCPNPDGLALALSEIEALVQQLNTSICCRFDVSFPLDNVNGINCRIGCNQYAPRK